MTTTIDDNERTPASQEYLLSLESPSGTIYQGRITGKLLAVQDRGHRHDQHIYLADDGRLLIHDVDHLKVYDVTDDPESGLQGFDPDVYFTVLEAIGRDGTVEPVVAAPGSGRKT
jgi:hypothetical protein